VKTKITFIAAILCSLGVAVQCHSQGYIVPNGVVTNFISGEISVMYNPTSQFYTGFALRQRGNNTTFSFDPVADVGVRVFLVSPNDPISLQPILAQDYTELMNPNTYVFNLGTPFYVGLYTGNQQFAPPNGIYSDPLFGWAELENVNGTIRLLDSALEYQGGGIYAGTQNIIPVPEPSWFAILGLGVLLLGVPRLWRLQSHQSCP